MAVHGMLDIETLGTKAGCVVLTVGAATFDPATGVVFNSFYEKIAFKDSVLRGLVVQPDTYAWWQGQPDQARLEAFSGEKTLATVALDFEQWVRDQKGVTDWWAQGSDFDFPIWKAAFGLGSMAKFPINFWEQRDTRTLYSVAGFDAKAFPRGGVYHNALDDSLHQIKCVHECYKLLGLAAPVPHVDMEIDDL